MNKNLSVKPTVLVAGGAGFLGSHLVDKLVSQDLDVLCIDNFQTGNKDNIRHLLNRKGFEFIRHNIWLPLYVEVDQIYNLACPASPVHYQNDPVSTLKTSVLGAINMLGLAKRQGARIFQASTSEVYGDPLEHPQKEKYWGNVNPIGPRACYDEGKRCAESLFFDYNRQFGVDIRVARIFNTFGPRMHPNDGRVVSNFITQAIAGDLITIYGDGSQTRSFCYVDDLIDAIILMMERDFRGPLNLGNPLEISVLELAETVIKLTGSSSKLSFKPLPENDPQMRRPDISAAENNIGWKPRVNLKDGLKETINYFKFLLGK